MFRFLKRLRLAEKLALVDLLLFDCDGTLTDGKMIGQYKTFNAKDGMGIVLLNDYIDIGIVSGDDSEEINKRAKKLSLRIVFKAIKNKSNIISQLQDKYRYIAFMGDDVNDIDAMKQSYLKFCPSDAVCEVKNIADYVTKAKGGEGAVREICDMIRSTKDGRR
jgi:3-deoxy-D-manno-octulosonate 8-phosphate phosphatase (KDO 8-P phosphatase)